jgi:hypothetical protein
LRILNSGGKLKRFALLMALAGGLCVAGPDAGDASVGQGIDWRALVLRATGSGPPDVNALNAAQARFGAEKAARADALRALMAQVRAVEITAGKPVGDAMASEEIRGKIEAILRGFAVTAKRYYSDMGIEIDVEVSLAPLTDLFATAPAAEPAKSATRRKFTGLVIDARKLKVVPALEPRLLDSSGQVLYGVESLSADARKTAGVASYAHSIDQAQRDPRVADKPLVLRAANVQGSDLIVGEDERKKMGEGLSFLADGRVIILAD